MSSEIAVVAGLCRSLQPGSSNAAVLRAAARLAPDGMEIVEFDALGTAPPLDVTLDGDGVPSAVRQFRAAVGAADGMLIVSPEYAHTMPGVLKNALDWLVASGALANLPIALIGASSTHTGAIRGQIALIETLLAQSARIAATLTLPGNGRLDASGELVEAAALRRVGEVLLALARRLRNTAWLTA